MESHSQTISGLPVPPFKPAVSTANRPVKRSSTSGSQKNKPPKRRVRTKQDFLDFCAAVLQYADYQPDDEDNETEPKFEDSDFNMNTANSANDSMGNSSDSNSSDVHQDKDAATINSNILSSEEDELITCFCNKPFAGRPMIECGSCETWIHLSCAKIRRTNIPEVFICGKCREASQTARKSTRVRTENKKFTGDL